jgi:hypothetical protein
LFFSCLFFPFPLCTKKNNHNHDFHHVISLNPTYFI